MGAVTNGIKGVFRVGQTLSVLGRTGFNWVRGDRPPTPTLLRQTFENLGATYIKLGQFIASSPTFFPKEYVEEFQFCLDKTPSLPFSVIKKIIRDELGRPIDQVYSEIDPVALASASIAQVHAARLVTGEEVVIKVQKPGVENILLTDLNFLYLSARILETLAPKLSWTSLSGIVDEIQKTMMEECDFIKEANNLKVFRAFLQATHNDDATAPKVYEQCSTRRILTMERFHGVPLTDLDSIRAFSRDPERTLITAMNTWFASLTQCEFFHADVHAGNLMVLEDGRVGFIDFGIVGRIKPDTWQAVSDFISAIMVGNFDGMADAMIRIGVTRQTVRVAELSADLQRLYRQMDRMVPDDAPYEMEQADDDVNSILMDMVKVGESHGLHFPREFALLLKQFLYFDRYVHILAPEMDVFMDERLTMLH
ncbi:AarF/ABC1/UbiB kinase family protein [Marinobacter daepoensis]|uniref:AarF/ABC1/UbiB kinase family protein n=1 Tax=Marinobacter daepoensis TaxID=262077 RepID=A0ABS3BGV3_9GAMM|nr:AarF/ABC1/UbiB kinase family protein [Marinobacter daepoensis]MBN7769947.1 AarF/ABC1/UbiB kinase family protein [Marinobacter daepoensis]MBY6032628.1 AarF/ABC1/UbiB kinase family protein [Marinobacter daepoensis]MBY6080335.1 AarF/ABC1/UbiB kinase family protein [Marinobacter daepoensis]